MSGHHIGDHPEVEAEGVGRVKEGDRRQQRKPRSRCHEGLTFLFEAAPQASLDTLRAVFPELAPAPLRRLLDRIHHQARRHRRPHLWWSDDVEAAIQQTNTLTRPWGRKGPTPDERWQARPRLTDTARKHFHCTVLQELNRIIQTRGKTNGRQRSKASIMRTVVRRQLVRAGHLYIGGA